jgi:hypothetical protein
MPEVYTAAFLAREEVWFAPSSSRYHAGPGMCRLETRWLRGEPVRPSSSRQRRCLDRLEEEVCSAVMGRTPYMPTSWRTIPVPAPLHSDRPDSNDR